MANKEHLALLKQGVEVWNNWRENNPEVRPDLIDADLCVADLSRANLSGANLSGTYLSGADLSETNLSRANLSEANLRDASLRDANLGGASLIDADLCVANLGGASLFNANLNGANLSEASLFNANLNGANLCGADLSWANLGWADLSEADLSEADLSETDLGRANLCIADLSGANLNGANLSRADLSGASLLATQALATNFEKALFTASCLEDWNINRATRLEGVICDYIYLKSPDQERRPHSGNFAPGEFTKLFQKALETVDLIFRDGIDWEAFLTSYQKLQAECGDEELSIQAIENKNDGTFVIRLNVAPDANKVEIEKYLKQEYALKLQAKDEFLKFSNKKVDFYCKELKNKRQENTNLLRIIETMAEKENSNYYFEKPQIGKVINHQYHYSPEQKQTLTEAAAEIQRLLEQLEENNPDASEAEQKAYVTASIPLSVRQRILSALQAGGKEAMNEFLDKFLDYAYLNVAIAVFEDWRETK